MYGIKFVLSVNTTIDLIGNVAEIKGLGECLDYWNYY